MTYPFKLQPYKHQREALEKSWDKSDFALLMDMGTGKTKVTIDSAGIAFRQGWIDGLLIIAPKGVYRNWDLKEIPKHLPDEIEHRKVAWRGTPNKAEKYAMKELLSPVQGTLDIFVINIDAINSARGYKYVEAFMKSHKTMIVIDESTKIKTPKAGRTKKCLALSKLAVMRRILTGSPLTRSPEDLFSQFKFLNTNILGFTSFVAYKARYCILREMHIPGKRPFKQVVGFQHLDELQEKIADHSYRVMLGDCVDMPSQTYKYIDVEMTDEQKDIYASLLQEAIATLDDKECTAPLALTKILRLHQVACGHVTWDDGTTEKIKNKRIDALMDTLSEYKGKAVIWANYRADLAEIEQAIISQYGQDAIGTYHGGTSDSERIENLASFEDPDSPMRFLLSNTQTGGMGIDMLQGTLNIFYSNSHRLEDRLQAEKRSWRNGQTKPVLYVDIRCPGTIDEKIIQALKGKQELASMIMGDEFRDWLA
jgi:SNF2 family DNA or RNA helicase